MAYAFGSETEASSSASVTYIEVALSTNPANGSLLYVASRVEANTTSTITDTYNSWTNIGSVVEAGTSDELFHAYAKAITGGANTVRATFGASSANPGIYILEISGIDATAPLVDNAEVTDTGNDPTTTATNTNTGTAGVLISVGNDVQGGLLTAGTGMTSKDTSIWASTAAQRGTVQYKTVSADSNDYTSNFGNGSISRANQVAAIFKESVPVVLAGTGSALALTGGNAAPEHSGILGTGNFFDAPFFSGGFFGTFAAGDPELVGTGTALALAGGTAALKADRILVGTGTALAATGGTALPRADRILIGTGTALTLTGAEAGFNFVRGMSGTGTALALTGGTALPRADRILVGTGTALALAGGDALMVTGRVLVGTGTALALTGGTAALRVDRILVGTGTLLTLTGGDATLTKSGAGSKTLDGTGTALTLSGGTALLKTDRILSGEPTALALTGGTAELRVDRILSGEASILSLFGGNADLEKSGGTPVTPAAPAVGGAGGAKKKKQRVFIGERLYEFTDERDLERLLRWVARNEPEAVQEEARKAIAKPKKKAKSAVEVPKLPKIELASPVMYPPEEWMPLWEQLNRQSADYARVLAEMFDRLEEEDIETLLLSL